MDMKTDWLRVLKAYLHRPPDHVLDEAGSADRAVRYAQAAFDGLPQDPQATAEELLALGPKFEPAWERFPWPKIAPRLPSHDSTIEMAHPQSGGLKSRETMAMDEELVLKEIRNIVAGLPDPRSRYLALWRLLPERLADKESKKAERFAWLPADVCQPDHSIWQVLDLASAWEAATVEGDAALLSFNLGPVQSFIGTARSVRDLWSGSMILSWLALQSLLPIVEHLGPASVLFPALRGVPHFDLHLRDAERGFGLEKKIPEPGSLAKRSPCLPNRFLALIPSAQATFFREACLQATKDAWQDLFGKVRNFLQREWSGLSHDARDWDRLWDDQIKSYFDLTCAVLPLTEETKSQLPKLYGHETWDSVLPDSVKKLRAAAEKFDPIRAQRLGTWQTLFKLSAGLLEAQRSVRHVPKLSAKTEDVPQKCSLFGSYEQMGPANLQESRTFWESVSERSGGFVKSQERLCALALTKRYAEKAYFRKVLNLGEHTIPDTAMIAARRWLKQAQAQGIDLNEEILKSGQWLHWPNQEFDSEEDPIPMNVWELLQAARSPKAKLGKPPTYYAVLMMDGDRMGQWLEGETAPTFEQLVPEEVWKQLNGTSQELKKIKRPVTPLTQAGISRALAQFSIHNVPEIVTKHHGHLIYSGGDDVFALLPLETALICALELRCAFSGCKTWQQLQEVHAGTSAAAWDSLGSMATASAGLAVVQYKEDLRIALEMARKAEKAAKNAGRNALQISVARRSGSHDSALCPWDWIDTLEGYRAAFVEQASDRWTYHLRGEMPTLLGLPWEAIRKEVERQLQRAEPETQAHFVPKDVADKLNDYRKTLWKRKRENQSRDVNDKDSNIDSCNARAFEDFLKLCQTASFFARGRES